MERSISDVLSLMLPLFSLAYCQPMQMDSHVRVALEHQGKLPQAEYLLQKQDHFDPHNTNTWHQAYYVNDTYWRPGTTAPVFLCVGGEGPPLDGSAVVHSVHCNIAVEWLHDMHAIMFALEHRYYGCHNMSACPVQNFTSIDSLQFLSSRQAIEDVAHFITTMNAKYSLKATNKWITWGGSYPGMLAGWSRLKHPELIHSSVASSAPIHAKLNMKEYLDHVAFAYTVSNNGVGGSSECKNAIRAGHAWIENNFENATGIAAVEKRFGLQKDSLSTRSSRLTFAASGVANFPGQENDPLCPEPACNIAKICAIMTNTAKGDEVQRLIELRKAQSFVPTRERKGATQLPNFWYYQTCTEFGFYQTCEIGSDCMFVRGLLGVEDMASGCSEYGIKILDIERSINDTNKHYGPLVASGSCVLWPNGEVDPWSTLSVLRPPVEAQPVLYVPGASHHVWTWPSRAGDQQSVTQARAAIRSQVLKFLSDDCSMANKNPWAAEDLGIFV